MFNFTNHLYKYWGGLQLQQIHHGKIIASTIHKTVNGVCVPVYSGNQIFNVLV